MGSITSGDLAVFVPFSTQLGLLAVFAPFSTQLGLQLQPHMLANCYIIISLLLVSGGQFTTVTSTAD